MLAIFVVLSFFSQSSAQPCILTNSMPQTCLMCSYNYYDQFFQKRLIVENILQSSDCLPKNTTTVLTRKILIKTGNSSTNSTFFDDEYFQIFDAFYTETINFYPYMLGNLTVYFSLGTHFLLKPDFYSKNNIFFDRVSVIIKFLPLFCNDFNLTGFCVDSTKKSQIPNVLVKYGLFSFSISNKFEIQNIIFDFIDLASSNFTCLLLNLVQCCTESILNQNNSNCQTPQNYQPASSKSLTALFEMRAIFDDQNSLIPEIIISNVDFKNLYFFGQNFISFGSLITTDEFGGKLNLLNVTLNNFDFEGFAFAFNPFGNSGKSNPNQFIYLYNLSFSEGNISNLLGLVFLKGFKGNVSMGDIVLRKLLNKQPKKRVAIYYFEDIGNNIKISQHQFYDNTNCSLIYAGGVNISFYNMSLKFLKWNQNVFYFSQCLNLYFENFFLFSSISFYTGDSSTFSSFENSNVLFNSSYFDNLTSFAFSSKDSLLSFSSSIISRSNIGFAQITCTNSSFYFTSCNFTDLINFNNLFYFSSSPISYFSKCLFANLSGKFLFAGTTIYSLNVLNSIFNNITGMTYVFSKSTSMYYVFLSQNYFSNLSLGIALLSLLNQVTLIISYCSFTSISFELKTTANFIAIQNGKELVENSNFTQILIKLGGSTMIKFMNSDATVINSYFKNNGWVNLVNPATLSSIDYINLFYIWTCTNAIFDNNTFINEGKFNFFSGFIHCTLHQYNFTLTRNSFSVSNKFSKYYYMGVIISNAQYVIITENQFTNLECPTDFASFIHNNGVLTAQGDNTFQKSTNHKIIIVSDNVFLNCSCKNAGSFGVINFDSSFVSNITIKNSRAVSSGGGMLLACATILKLTNISVYNTSAYLGSVMLVKKITFMQQESIFSDNSYAFWDGGSFFMILIQQMTINNITIFNSASFSQGGVFKFFEGEIKLVNSFFLNCSAYNAGGILYLTEFGNLTIENFSSTNNFALYGGVIYISSSINVLFANLNIFNSISQNKGAALYIDLISNLNITELKIINCHTFISGVLYLKNVETVPNFNLENIYCENNSADAGSCIFGETRGFLALSNLISENCSNSSLKFDTNEELFINLFNCSILNSITLDYIIFLSQVEISLQNIVISQNLATKALFYIELTSNFTICDLILVRNSKNNSTLLYEACVFLSFASNVILKNIIFNSEFPENISFLIDQDSKYVLYNIFIKNVSHSNMAMIRKEDGNLSMCNFEVFSSQGPIISCTDCLNFELISASFSSNLYKDKDLYTDLEIISKYLINSMKILIFHSIFQNTHGIFTSFSECFSIILSSTIFTGANFSRAIQISNSLQINIKNSSFSNFTNFDGNSHGISIINDKTLSIQTTISIINCDFNNNQALFAPSLFIIGLFNFTLSGSCFIKNVAFKSYNLLASGIGGVGYTFCYKRSRCSIKIENSSFFNNSAESLCPTFYSNSLITINNTIFLGNWDASNFSQSLTSFPLTFNTTTTQITSGANLNIAFVLFDVFQQPFHTELKITSLLMSTENSGNIILLNTISKPTNTGTFIFPTLLIKAKPNSTIQLNIIVDIKDLILGQTNTLKQSFSFYSRSCLVGEIYTIDNTCVRCPVAFFSLYDPMDPSTRVSKCSSCLSNALCLGGSFLIPKAGYWRPSKTSSILDVCILPSACIGFPSDLNETDVIENYQNYQENEDLIHGGCAAGHVGRLCFDCIEGYGKESKTAVCTHCSDKMSLAAAKVALVGAIVLAYLIFNVKSLKNKKSEINALTLKIFQNHMQKLSLIAIVNVEVGSWDFSRLFYTVNQFSLMDENSFANECFLQKFTEDLQSGYGYKIFFLLALPPMCMFFCMIILKIINILLKKFQSSLKLEVYMVFLIAIFLFYPLIIRNSLSVLNCFVLDETDDQYLFASPNVLCWTGFHKVVLTVSGLVGIFFYGIFFPLYLMLIIFKNIEKFNSKARIYASSMNEKESSAGQSRHDVEKKITLSKAVGFKMDVTVSHPLTMGESNFMRQDSSLQGFQNNVDLYRFFFKDYKEQYFYWESVIFLLKFFLSLISNIANIITQENSDMFFVFFICVYTFMLIKKEPFKILQLNKMELGSNVCLIFSKLTSVIFQSNKAAEGTKIMCSFLFLLSNLIFVVYMLFSVFRHNNWKDIYKQAKSQYSKIHKLVKSGIQRQMSSREKVHREKKTKVITVLQKKVKDVTTERAKN